MNLTVILVGLFVLALFILPFYFVVRKSEKDTKNNAVENHPESTVQSTKSKSKQKGYQKV
jgi:phosphotransferase system  glucose/maltose/N-acetylglucosamine-specific IIC component